MPTISTKTTIAVPAGALLMFKAGGSGRAIDDAGNVYIIGLSDMQMGPYSKAQTVEVQITSGSITYAVEADGVPSNAITKDPYTSQIVDTDGDAVGVDKRANTVVLFGDSMTSQNNRTYFGSSQVAALSRTSGVATLQISSHGMWTGSEIRVAGVPEAGFDGYYSVTRVDANNVSFACPGVDATATRTSCMVMDRGWRSTTGYFFWLQMSLGGRLKLIANSGINGQTTAQMLARVQDNVIAFSPQYAINLGGYNDLIQGFTAAATLQNLLDIATAQVNAGITPVMITPIPMGSGAAMFNAANVEKLRVVARGLVAAAAANTVPGMIVVDAYDLLVDRNNTVNIGAAKANVLSDDIHPSWRGAKIIGEACYESLKNVAIPVQRLPSSYADVTTSGTGGYNVVKAGPYTTSGGTTTAPVTGTTASSITTQRGLGSTGSAVASVQTLADGSLRQRLVITPGGVETWVVRSNDGAAVLSLLTSGERRRLVAALKITGIAAGAPFQDFTFNFNFTIDGVTYYHYATLTTTANFLDSDVDGVVISDPIRVPTGTITNCGWRFELRTTGAGSDITVDIGRIGYLLES